MPRLSLNARIIRRFGCMLALLPLFVATYWAAYWLRFEGDFGSHALQLLTATLPWVVLAKVIAFGAFRFYQGWGRYLTFHDLVVLAEAATAGSLAIVLCDYLALPGMTIPRSIVLMDWGATIMGVGGLRALLRLVQDREGLLFLSADRTPALIVGANDSGEALLRAIARGGNIRYQVVGFICEDGRGVGTRIGGVPVVGALEETCEAAHRLGVKEVLITAGELSGRQVRHLLEEGRRAGVVVRVLPSYEQLLRGSVAVRPRPVAIGDLLQRDQVELDGEAIRSWVEGRVLLVTGSAGSIGSEICRQLLNLSPTRLVLVDRSENGQFFLERELRQLDPSAPLETCIADITDAARMASIFEQYRPDIVFHAAAYKHVPLMEDNCGEAVKNIPLATRGLVDLASRHDVGSFVMISTDKAVNPTSVMGACKQVAEQYVQAMAAKSSCRFVTVRFGNVLDSAGSVVPIFRQQIAAGGPVTVTHPEITRYFMTIPEASQLVIQAGAMGQGGEIFVLDMGQPVRIVDLASDMIRLSGLRVGEDIEIEYSGLRPGEKMYEELYDAREKHTATPHPKILVADGAHRELDQLRQTLRQLEAAADQGDLAVTTLLQQIVPEFYRDTAEGDDLRRPAA